MVSYQSVVVLDNKKTMVLQTVAELGMVVFDNRRTAINDVISGYGRL
jgi:hypothetical protein